MHGPRIDANHLQFHELFRCNTHTHTHTHTHHTRARAHTHDAHDAHADTDTSRHEHADTRARRRCERASQLQRAEGPKAQDSVNEHGTLFRAAHGRAAGADQLGLRACPLPSSVWRTDQTVSFLTRVVSRELSQSFLRARGIDLPRHGQSVGGELATCTCTCTCT